MTSESRLENREPSKAIVAFLLHRLDEGREFNATRLISEGTGLSMKMVGTRMHGMMKNDWHGLDISVWSETIWLVKRRVKDGRRGIRATV